MSTNKFKTVKKRDGRIVSFDQERITIAVRKAMESAGEGDPAKSAGLVSDRVVSELNKRYPASHTPAIEEIQDAVEESLILMDFPKTAKAYILYRQKRTEVRAKSAAVPDRVKVLTEESKKYFRNPLAEFIYYRTYSRWIEEEGRRETWIETVDRYMDFMKMNLGGRLSEDEYREVRFAILKQEAMPSMRLFWSAGKAAGATHAAAYNCSFLSPRQLEDFAEIMYLLMCGAGVGFSVENQNVQQLPIIKRQTGKTLPPHVIDDSKEGWGNAITLGLKTWYRGQDITFDYSKLRPAGARLKTMGGRSSGPEPLRSLLDFARAKILSRQGRRLSSLDVHDIICKIGEIVVAGGVRRCLPQNTLVHTKSGLKLIKNLVPGEEVLTSPGRYRRVIASQYTGRRQLVSVHTQLGIFQSTPEHRWAVLADLFGNIKWVEAAALTPNDILVHIPEVIPGRKTTLPFYRYKHPQYSTTTIDIKIPELDEDIAWLVGYLHGDGYVFRKSDTYGEVMFACSPDMPQTAERLKNILERFGVKAQIVRYKYDKSIRIRVKSNQLANYFYQFKQPKESLIVPDFILGAEPEIRASYIAGVFDADGSVKSRNGKRVRPIAASSIYFDWLRQLRAILASLGVSANIRQARPPKGNWQALYHLLPVSMESFARFRDWMSGRSEKWQNDAASMARKKEQNSFVVPRNLLAVSPYRTIFARAYYAPLSRVSLSFSKFEKELKRHHAISTVSVVEPMRREWAGETLDYRPVRVEKLTSGVVDDTYDIQVEGDECFVAEGMLVHNSALISLSDLDDEEMRGAKQGPFYFSHPQRQMANNSAVYNSKPSSAEFLEEWLALAKSGTGERGIFNRGSLDKQLPARRWKTFQKHWSTCGTNPCGEIILPSKSFCNLSEVVARAEDTEETLLKKIRVASIIGTYQSTLTTFPYLSKEWRKNCEEERLLGVSITGQWDSPAVRNLETLQKLRERAILVNREYAKRFGINESTCVTCVKPSGTVSQLVDAASGMHPRHAPYYIRRVRISATDPLFQMLREQKFPYHPEVGQLESTATTFVLDFPVKAPEGALFRNDASAEDQLMYWKMVKQNYTEHNPSVTVSVGPDEWIRVADWLYANWDWIGGLSFLPREEHVYQLAPYEEISAEEYQRLVAKLPEIDFSAIMAYEREDFTTGAKELACVGNVCEVDVAEAKASS